MIPKRFTIMTLILSLAVVSTGSAFAQLNTESTLYVDSLCGINPTGNINYGNIQPGSTSGDVNLYINGTGNAPSIVRVQGTNWIEPINSTTIVYGENTKFSFIDNIDFVNKTAISTTGWVNMDTNIDNIVPTLTYWEVWVDVLVDTYKGSVAQTLVFEVSGCEV